MQQRSGCGRANRVRPLSALLVEARAQAAREGRALLYPSGFVFHESRVGSTLTANILAAVPTHLVYSEGFRMPCASCEPAAKLRALRDYVALMGNSASHARLFIKFQSAMTPLMPLIAQAFPDVPWLFIFREPVQVMMSHGERGGFDRAVCTSGQRSPPSEVCAILAGDAAADGGAPRDAWTPRRRGAPDTGGCRDAPKPRYCAAHLARLCDSAIGVATRDLARCGGGGLGRVIEYSMDLATQARRGPLARSILRLTVARARRELSALPPSPARRQFMDDVLPNTFGLRDLPREARQAMVATSKKYSKNPEAKIRGHGSGEYKSDSLAKERKATAEVREVADEILKPRFVDLKRLEDRASVDSSLPCPKATARPARSLWGARA